MSMKDDIAKINHDAELIRQYTQELEDEIRSDEGKHAVKMAEYIVMKAQEQHQNRRMR